MIVRESFLKLFKHKSFPFVKSPSRYFTKVSYSNLFRNCRKKIILIFLITIISTFFINHFALASSGESEGSHLISSIGISVLAAMILAFFGNFIKQPLLLSYIVAGVIIGPKIGLKLVSSSEDIKVISEIGLILLLFMIGLEINMKKLKEAGKSLLTAGVFQFIICVSLGFGFFYLIGYTFTEGNYDLLYLAVCLGISSTAIVVKILYDKFELDTLAGRLTLGILVFQDIWAIVILAIQPNLAEPDLLLILWSFAKGVILVLISLLFSKYVLGRIYKAIAKNPELILAASLSWCFLICGIANYFELSLEMGALIAGIAISSFPYNIDIIAKISNIRNFFLMLFFVGLGMMIPNPMDNLGLLAIAGIASVFLIATRFISIFPILHAFKNGNRVSLLVPINLSQISEFSLVIAAIGLAMGHIGTDILSIIIFIFAFTSIISTYMIQFSHSLQNTLNKIIKKIGIKDIEDIPSETKSVDKDIAILGFFREASSLIREIVDHQEEIEDELKLDNKKSIKDDIVVVDFNPHVHEELNKIGIKAIYGDISNMDTLQHAGIHSAKLVISTIPDSILKGTNNLNMMKHIKKLCPNAKIIVTAESTTKALELYKEGADYVFLPRILATNQLIPVIERLLKEESNKYKSEEIKKLKSRDEIID